MRWPAGAILYRTGLWNCSLYYLVASSQNITVQIVCCVPAFTQAPRSGGVLLASTCYLLCRRQPAAACTMFTGCMWVMGCLAPAPRPQNCTFALLFVNTAIPATVLLRYQLHCLFVATCCPSNRTHLAFACYSQTHTHTPTAVLSSGLVCMACTTQPWFGQPCKVSMCVLAKLALGSGCGRL